MKNLHITLEVLTLCTLKWKHNHEKDFAIERNYANIYAPLKLHAYYGEEI